ncbi:hypothetical protein AB9T88_12395 [Flavobacterium sp. LBUM151]
MKIIIKSIAILLFFLAFSCTESEDSQSVAAAKTTIVKKSEVGKEVSSMIEEDDEMIHPKRK